MIKFHIALNLSKLLLYFLLKEIKEFKKVQNSLILHRITDESDWQLNLHVWSFSFAQTAIDTWYNMSHDEGEKRLMSSLLNGILISRRCRDNVNHTKVHPIISSSRLTKISDIKIVWIILLVFIARDIYKDIVIHAVIKVIHCSLFNISEAKLTIKKLLTLAEKWRDKNCIWLHLKIH